MLWICVMVQIYPVSLVLLASEVVCFWPAPYQIHLQHHEKFEFSAEIGGFDDDEDMEMFKENELAAHNLQIENYRLDRLHKHFQAHKPNEEDMDINKNKKLFRQNDYINDEENILFTNSSYTRFIPGAPLYGEFFRDKSLDVAKRTAVNKMANDTDFETQNDTTIMPGNNSSLHLDQDDIPDPGYDYEQLKEEYYGEVENALKSNETYNYTDVGKPEETVKESFEKIIDMKMPRNCTKEEATNFGLLAVECIVDDYKHVSSKKGKWKVFKKAVKIALVWLLIACIIATVLYCKYGWCCCCCVCCGICNPKKIIYNAKKYAANNPPGEFELPDGSKQTFTPTIYEIDAYENLLKYVKNL